LSGNVSNFPREITEMALAHVIGDKAEQAYRRSEPWTSAASSWKSGFALDPFRRRSQLMISSSMATILEARCRSISFAPP
jgi:hypothetical protein